MQDHLSGRSRGFGYALAILAAKKLSIGDCQIFRIALAGSSSLDRGAGGWRNFDVTLFSLIEGSP